MEKTHSPSTSHSSVASWELGDQLNAAFTRTKDRFGKYIYSILLYFGIACLFILAIGILAGAAALIYTTTQSVVATGIVGGIAVIAYIVGIVYISSLWALMMIKIIISEEKITARQALKESQSIVLGYIGFTFLTGLFFMGLLIWGILSLGIILILWSIWASFGAFVYVIHRKKGLENLWYSQAMVSQKFWGILGRFVLVNVAIFIIQFVLQLAAEDYPILSLVIIAFSLFTTPFLISFQYEMFRGLSVPEKVEKPTFWIGLSIVGGLIMAAVLVLGIFSAIQSVPKMIEEERMKREQKQELQRLLQDPSMNFDYTQELDYDSEMDVNYDPSQEVTIEEFEEELRKLGVTMPPEQR